MKRRNLLKGIGMGSLGLLGFSTKAPAAELLHPFALELDKKDPIFEQFGRTEDEKKRDAKLFAEQFFTKSEMKTITVLVDIILPRDARSGSASEAGVPEFIEFMAKDRPDELQTPLRGGLRWLDHQAIARFGKIFTDIHAAQRIEIVDDIAYPGKEKPGMSQGVSFFNLMRNLTASGFWSSKMGIEDIGYQGNVPNQWDGVPEDVQRQYGLL
ncbi:MAG: gluconate 2-dehydrogenase subunit 3 family protein [Bacteroidetes bacterium]|nr:gluconate 2-dehydrogenase subunit 3 family protein [Bacteroidota bacterium]